ncbi:MAG: hypothetical protein R3240_00690 [Gammaproteobacteria bacterium]|nr:hypothetical protein [Gammaproteobacteria bacterium]
MTTRVFDTFTGTSGTDLSAHTPDTDLGGGGWIDEAANQWELDGSGGAKWNALYDGSWIYIGSGISDQWCTANFNAGGADNRISISLRRDNAALFSRTCYDFNLRTGDTVDTVRITKIVAGTSTVLSATTALTLGLSTTYSLEPECNGSALDWIIDGVSKVSVTDASITSGNYAGIVGYLRTDANGRFYDFQIDDTAGGGTTVSVGLATETQTAFSITPLRTKPVGQAVSNESGLSVTASKAYGLGFPVETNSAFLITKQKTFSLNIANESDNPFSLSINKAFQLNLGLETDSAFSITKSKLFNLNISLESNSAFNVTPILAGATIIPVGMASEIDSPISATINKAFQINLGTESDSALLVTPVLAGITIVPVGLVGEIDIAQSLSINRMYSLNLANESDVGLSAIPVFSRTIITGIAQEVNFPLSISILKAFNIGQAIETDSALSVILAGGSIGRFSAGNKILLTGRIYNQIVLTGRTSNRVDIFND